MAKLTLYAYVQGNDFEKVVSTIEERLDALVAERTWVSKDVWVVNQQETAAPPTTAPATTAAPTMAAPTTAAPTTAASGTHEGADAGAQAAPIWDLGLNLALTAKRSRPANWVEDLEAIATTFGALHRETGRTFVLGVHDEKASTTEDLFFVDSASPDLDRLRAAFADTK